MILYTIVVKMLYIVDNSCACYVCTEERVIVMGKDEKIKELTEKDLEKVSGGILDDLPTVEEHDYDEDVKEKIKMP